MTGLFDTSQSGDGPDIMLTEEGKPLTQLKDRWKVTEKMFMIPQYAFAGDFTGMYSSVQSSFSVVVITLYIVEAITKGVTEVAKYDAGGYIFVLSFTKQRVLIPW